MASVKVPLQPFMVPSYVFAEKKVSKFPNTPQDPQPQFPIEELDAEVLSDLCDEFRERVFFKADKVDPRAAKS